MRTVIQRVQRASVKVNGSVVSNIEHGYLILLGVEATDTEEDIQWLCRKVLGLRVFDDENGVMNRNILDVDGNIIVVSQFTLYASYKKGNRPSWLRAAGHDHAVPMDERFVEVLGEGLGRPVGTGEFGADMKIEQHNDGPVTILLEN